MNFSRLTHLLARFLFFISLGLLAPGCVSRSQVLNDYMRVAPTQAEASHRTLVFFLIDGLAVQKCQELLSQGDLPATRDYFLQSTNEFRIGRAVFPSLTHANISSILTAENVDQQPIIGNKMVSGGIYYNFESPSDVGKLATFLKPQSVFWKLTRHGLRSASFASYYGDGASAHYPLDPAMGLAYSRGDYAYVDTRFTGSLERLLKNTAVVDWPAFIFVHLIGIDSLAHTKGLDSPQLKKHARLLDAQLAPIYTRLRAAETKGHAVGAILTADHGMINIDHQLSVERALAEFVPQARGINNQRSFGIYFSKSDSIERRRQLLVTLSNSEGIESATLNDHNLVTIFTAGQSTTVRAVTKDCGRDGQFGLIFRDNQAVCPDSVSMTTAQFLHHGFVVDIVRYFQNKNSPDALVVPKPGYAFGSGPSAHGGPTLAEMTVPVLTHNVWIDGTDPVVRVHRLLESFTR